MPEQAATMRDLQRLEERFETRTDAIRGEVVTAMREVRGGLKEVSDQLIDAKLRSVEIAARLLAVEQDYDALPPATKLEGMRLALEALPSASEMAGMKLSIDAMAKAWTKYQENAQWRWRTVVGALIVSFVALVVSLFKAKVGLP